jgi:GNAT superfamily N-acetyltransferase
MAYEIRRYEAGFRDQVLELQRHLWSPDLALNDRCFAWKYERNPWVSEPLILLAVDGRRVVGMRGAFAIPWVVGPERRALKALSAGDTVVAPDHRRRGLASQINEALVAEARRASWEFLINTSAGRVVRRLSAHSGWRTTEEIWPLTRRPKGVAPRLWPPMAPRSSPFRAIAWLSHRSRRDLGLLDVLDRRLRREVRRRSGGVRISLTVCPERMAALAASTSTGGRIRLRKDVPFFRWRFSNPLSGYRFLFAHEGGGPLTAYVAVQAHGPLHDTGLNLVDWEASSPEALGVLLSTLVGAVGAERINTWPCEVDPTFHAAFSAAGFRPVPRPEPPSVLPAIMCLPLRDASSDDAWSVDGVDLTRLEDWDLRMTASDFY